MNEKQDQTSETIEADFSESPGVLQALEELAVKTGLPIEKIAGRGLRFFVNHTYEEFARNPNSLLFCEPTPEQQATLTAESPFAKDPDGSPRAFFQTANLTADEEEAVREASLGIILHAVPAKGPIQ